MKKLVLIALLGVTIGNAWGASHQSPENETREMSRQERSIDLIVSDLESQLKHNPNFANLQNEPRVLQKLKAAFKPAQSGDNKEASEHLRIALSFLYTNISKSVAAHNDDATRSGMIVSGVIERILEEDFPGL